MRDPVNEHDEPLPPWVPFERSCGCFGRGAWLVFLLVAGGVVLWTIIAWWRYVAAGL